MTLVSVLMPAYNGGFYLREAVESILNQTLSDFEFIIIDDGSTDGTYRILTSYDDPRIRVVRQENTGLTKALNRGLKMARGQYVARQDADDISLPDRLERQVSVLDEQPDLVIVGTDAWLIDEAGKQTGRWRYPHSDLSIRWQTLFHCSFVHTSVIIRREALVRHGLQYDEQITLIEDYDLWSKLLCFGQGLNISDPLVQYRLHSAQVSQQASDRQQMLADKVSQANLQQLGFSLSRSAVRTLRNWSHKFPSRLTSSDMLLCRIMLQIIDAFERQYRLVDETSIIRQIRRQWVGRMLNAMSRDNVVGLWTSGLFKDLVLNNPYMVARISVGGMLRRLAA